MSIGAGGVIDEFFVALGFKVDPAGMRGVRQQVDEAKSSILSLGGALKTFVAGFALHEVASIGSEFEQSGIQIAGFLNAFGYSSDFNSALNQSNDIIKEIVTQSAKLPGQASEYIDTFRMGIPVLKEAMPGANLQQMSEFTNRVTAIGRGMEKTLQQPGMIGMELQEMLEPGQGAVRKMAPLFRALLPVMREASGMKSLSAATFNALPSPKRLELMQAALDKMQPMLIAEARTFDALWGTAVSTMKLLTLNITQPLFEGMKRWLKQLSDSIFDSKGNLTDFGQHFVDSAKQIIKDVGQIVSMLGGMLGWLVKSEVGSRLLKAALIGIGLALAGLALGGTISSFGKLFGVLTNIKRLLTGALFVAIALIAEDLYVFSQGGDSVTGMLVKKFGPGLMKVVGVVGVLGLLFLKFPTLMNRVGFSIGMMIGRVMLALGPLLGTIIRIGVVSLATGIRMAASWALALAPLLLIAAAAFAIGYGLAFAIEKALKLAGILKGPQEPEALKNFKSDPNFKRYGDDSGAPAFLRPLAPGRHPLGNHRGAGASSTDKSSHQTTTVGHITVVSPNPHEAGKAVHRSLARNAQTGVSH